MGLLRLFLTVALAASALLAQASDAASLKAALDTNGRVSVYGISDTSAASQPILMPVLRLLEDNPDLKLLIEAHTANDGTPEEIRKLSVRHLHSVTSFLFVHGVDRKRITIRAVGDKRPLGDNTTAEGRVMNRRIDLVKQ